jgi:hypothetical protein
MTARKPKQWKAWGGFLDGELDYTQVDDGYPSGWGKNFRRSPAIFKSRDEARLRFADVRPVTITLAKPKKKARKA